MCLLRNIRGLVRGGGGLTWLGRFVLLGALSIPVVAQTPRLQTVQGRETETPEARGSGGSAGGQQADRQSSSSISGQIVDPAGAVVVEAQVRLGREDQPPIQEILSDESGQFFVCRFISRALSTHYYRGGFGAQQVSGVLRPGEAYIVPEIRLAIATVLTEVQVGVELTQVEVAEEQIKEQEKQRVLGFIPNFFVSYVPDAAPLAPKQKFELAWRSTIDPFTFVGVARHCGSSAGDRRLRGIRARYTRLCETLRRSLCQRCCRYVHWKRDPAFSPKAGSPLFLQRNRERSIAYSVCARQYRDLQGGQ